MSACKRLLLPVFLAVAAISYMGPIIEGDFFWHLRAGETIYKSGGLPADYFSTQWLGQTVLYLIWKAGGMGGVIALRAVLYTAVLGLLFLWMRRESVPYYMGLFFVLLPAHLFLSFPSERPQLFSFLLFPVTLVLMESLRKGGRAFWFVPLVLLLWANMHAGFMIGAAAVWIYFISEAVSFARGKSSAKRLVSIAAVAISPALVFLIRPGALKVFINMISTVLVPSDYVKSMVEYLSPVSALMQLGELHPAYWVFLGLALYALIRNFRRMELEHILLIAFLSLISLKSQRFMPFLLMSAPIVARYYVFEAKKEWAEGRFLFYVFSLMTAFWLIFIPAGLGTAVSEGFPSGAAGFLNEAKPRGKVFNYHGWAGYLMWSAPGKKYFMPVEKMSPQRDSAYGSMLWAEGDTSYGGKPRWRALMDAYGLDIAVIPGISPVSGEILPLGEALLEDPGWSLVYSDNAANVFVRAGPGDRVLIDGNALGAGDFYRNMAAQAERGMETSPRKDAFRRALGHAQEKLGEE